METTPREEVNRGRLSKFLTRSSEDTLKVGFLDLERNSIIVDSIAEQVHINIC